MQQQFVPVPVLPTCKVEGCYRFLVFTLCRNLCFPTETVRIEILSRIFFLVFSLSKKILYLFNTAVAGREVSGVMVVSVW